MALMYKKSLTWLLFFAACALLYGESAEGAECPELYEKGVISLDFNPAFLGIDIFKDGEAMTVTSFHNVALNPGGTPPIEVVGNDLVARINNIDDLNPEDVELEVLTDLTPGAPSTVWPNDAKRCPDGMFPFEALALPQGFITSPFPGRFSVINMDDPAKTEYLVHQSTQLSSGFTFPLDPNNSPRTYHTAVFMDMDGDGLKDIVTVRSGFKAVPSVYPPFSELVWFRNPGSLLDPETPWEETVIFGGQSAGFLGPDMFLAIHDFDGDGMEEIVATHFFSGKKISIYGAPEGGTWAEVDALNNTSPPVRVVDVSTDQGTPFTIEIVDLNRDGRAEILATNHESDKCQFESDIPGRVYALEQPMSGNIFNDDWTTHILLDGIRPQPSMPDAMRSRMAPGIAQTFYPRRSEESNPAARPWIVVGGDEAGKVWILEPTSDEWSYDSTVILDINDYYGDNTTQTPMMDPFGITISTIGGPAIRYDRDGPDGEAELYIPVFEAKDIHVFGFRQGGRWFWDREDQVKCPVDATLSCPARITPTVDILVEIVFDGYPAETGWSLRAADSDEIVMEVNAGSYSSSDTDVAETFSLTPGREYTFSITDSYGDGICCGYGSGSWAIYAAAVPDSDLLVKGDGEYGSGEEVSFIVPGDGDSTGPPTGPSLPPFIVDEIGRCGEVIDAHLHLATWFSSAGPLLEEFDRSGVNRGLMYSVYGPTNPFGTDPNDDVSRISLESNGRIVGLASLNTTGVWEETREAELSRLSTALESDEFVGTKLAPPHTCLPLNGDIIREVVAAVAASPSPSIAIHSGTTPFCGPFGDIILGKRGCCEPEYVNPAFLEPLIRDYPAVSFVLLHIGSDFLDENEDDDLPNYGGTLVDEAVSLSSIYSNVYLEISAFLRKDENGEYQRPLARENLQKVVDAGLADRVIYGSDANQFPGGILPYMIAAVPSMIESGFSESERCLALEGNSKKVFYGEQETGVATDEPAPPTAPPTRIPAIPPSPTPQPSPPDEEECEDTMDEFVADSVAGMQGCWWLDENMARYGYLCQFLDVALVCPKTCDHCDVL